jgi:putative protease
MAEAEAESRVGVVKKFFAKLSVAAVELTEGPLAVGDTIHIKGHTTDFEEQVGSIEIDHRAVERAEAGALVGIKVKDRVREHDAVYRKSLE